MTPWLVAAVAMLGAGCGTFTGVYRPSQPLAPLYDGWFKPLALKVWEERAKIDSPIVAELHWALRADRSPAVLRALDRGGAFSSEALLPLRASEAEPTLPADAVKRHAALPSVAAAAKDAKASLANARAIHQEMAAHCHVLHEQASKVRESSAYNDAYKNVKVTDANGCLAERDLLWLILRVAESG